VIVFAGWTIPAYRRAAKHWKGRALRIMTMDNPWKGTPKQRLGALTAGIYIHPLADAVWVPGERQTTFARAMGFDQNQILRGLYSCDYESFRSVSKTDEEKRRFVFVGRFVSDKGIETLVAGYKKYRSMAIEPWELHCYGCGPLESKLQDQPGLTIKGFVQPDELPLEFAAASCLLLPSINENWAVVIHEAASAGLAILASEAAGAVAHLVQPRYNGYIFGVRDDNGLAEALNIFSMLPPDKRIAMSKASVSLAGQFTPTLWADGLLDFAKHNLKKVLTLVTGSV
jgi:glycosyltransferase involved in cell wall biosynthesis